MTTLRVIRDLSPTNYTRSALHSEHSIWPEKNCYVDLWIEVLHSLGLETRAALPFVLGTNFEDDQWTFFKPSHENLFDLYGVEVQELTVWKPLLEHALEHLAAGKLISTEADAYWLPDVAGTDYRRNHGKTTIVINALDATNETLEYFHNAAYFRLHGEDFRQLFRIDAPPDETFLPLYAEFFRVDRMQRLPVQALALKSLQLLRRYHARRVSQNPVAKFADHVGRHLPVLQERGLAYYHLWAFGSIRQLGAASELAAENLEWLGNAGALSAQDAAQTFRHISSSCKVLILKGARSVATKRQGDFLLQTAALAEQWDKAMKQLEHALGLL